MEPPNRRRLEPSLLPGEARPAALEPEPEPPTPPRRSWWRRVKLTLLWTFLVLLLLALIPPGAVLLMRWYAPPTTAFMLRSEVKPVAYVWVPRQRIPQSLRDAVVAAEDQKFWTHWGFDFIAIAEALEHNEKSKRKRGASTITQQTAKNLFLWPSRSWLRKGLEVSFTLLLEGLWPKERILEMYLNVAEFGPGVYGVEAAAQKFFKKSSEQLTPSETAQLAAVLPNPRKWRADRPGPYVQSRVDWILVHTGQAPRFAPAPRFSVFPDDATEPGAGTLPDAPADEAPDAEDDLIHDSAASDEASDGRGTTESTDPAAPAEPAATEPAADPQAEPQQEPEPPKETPRY